MPNEFVWDVTIKEIVVKEERSTLLINLLSKFFVLTILFEEIHNTLVASAKMKELKIDFTLKLKCG